MDSICLNSYGVVQEGKEAGCGGMFQDYQGHWIGGYIKHIGKCNSHISELWGVLECIEIDRENGFRRLIMQVDSKLMVEVIHVNHMKQVLRSNMIRIILQVESRIERFVYKTHIGKIALIC